MPALALLVALLVAGPAAAKDGDDGRRDVRATGSCSSGVSSQLRLRSRDGAISVEFELRGRHKRESWRVVLVHERRVAWRATLRTSSNRSLRIRRSLPDLDGPDGVTVRASGPGGHSCATTATLRA